MNLTPGTVRLTADGVVGVSGKPVRVFCANLVSGSGTAASTILKNGTSTAGTAYEQIDGIASKSVTKNYAGGLLFPSGCYADMTITGTAAADYITIICTTEP